MAGLPTILLEVENSAGTMVDVTRSLRRSAGYSITRGKTDRFGAVEASKLAFTVRNDDGKFTPLTGSLGLRLDRRVRLTHTVGSTVSRRFTGYVGPSPTGWSGARSPYLQITAYDKRPDMARKTMRQAIEEEFLASVPTFLYPMTEAAGAQQAMNIAGGNITPPLVPAGRGAAPVFGVPAGIGGEGASSVSMQPHGQTLAAQGPAPLPVTTGVTVAAVISTTGINQAQFLQIGDPNGVVYFLTVTAGGNIFAAHLDPDNYVINRGAITSGPGFADGSPHMVVLTSDGTTFRLYVDGIQRNSIADLVAPASVPNRVLIASTSSATASLQVGQVAYLGRLVGAGEVAVWASAVNGIPAESTDARAVRLGRYAGLGVGALEGGATGVAPQTIKGAHSVDYMDAVDLTEGGLTFIDGSGMLTFQNRRHRAYQRTPVITFNADDFGDDPAIAYDYEGLENFATGTRVGNGGATFTAQNATSIAAHDQYPADDLSGLLVTTDAEAQDIVTWRANRYTEPAPRLPDVTIDLLTATTALQQAVLTVELSDRIRPATLPLNAPPVGDLIVEGWTETVTNEEWSWAVNASPWAPEQQWVLEDGTYGVLDSTTRLGY